LLDPALIAAARVRIAQANRVVLVTHRHPDGDALGSTLALKRALESVGKQVVAVCHDAPPYVFRFLPGLEAFSDQFNPIEGDLVITLDCGDINRTGFPEAMRLLGGDQGSLINIDHHQRNDLQKLATINLVSTDASSASELVYEFLTVEHLPIDKATATNILAGIYNDTGGFRHSNTTPRVLEIASTLLLAGGRLRDITRHVANVRSATALKLWGIALERIRYHEPLGVVASVITRHDFELCDALPEDIAGAVNLINHVPEAKVALLCIEPSIGLIKASLRTELNSIDVARVANLFGGGGLKKAAGFSIPGTIAFDADGTWRVVTSTATPFAAIFAPDMIQPMSPIEAIVG